MGWFGDVTRRFPPIAARDHRIDALERDLRRSQRANRTLRRRNTGAKEKIRDLKRQLAAQSDEVVRLLGDNHELVSQVRASENAHLLPSQLMLQASMIREWYHLDDQGTPEDGFRFTDKLFSYSFARSHGVPIPSLYDRWDQLSDLTPAVLARLHEDPRPMILKSAYGHSAKGVADTRDLDHLMNVVATWPALDGTGRNGLAPPYFTEELLLRDGVPVDEIKVLAYYGEIGLVIAQRARDYRERGLSVRYLDGDGRDLGPVGTKYSHDPDLPLSPRLPDVLNTCRRLSLAIRRPYVRLDFLNAGDRCVLNEITPLPNFHPVVPAMDRELGDRWERARGRIRADQSNGMDPAPQWGPHDHELTFQDHSLVAG